MTVTRQPAVAGSFYPADPQELRNMLESYLQAAPADTTAPRAMIAPHAGYVFSGPVAASGYARLLRSGHHYRRIVLLGPAHRVAFRGLATTSASAFATPLGDVAVDREAIASITRLPQVHELDEAHRLEHSLEVHLPFLQLTLKDFSVVPLVVGDASAEEVCEVIEALWTGPDTLVIVSSDLSHYHDYETATRLDSATTRQIEQLDYQGLAYDQACGRNPVSGLLLFAQHHGLSATTIDLRNSGDTAGPRDQVVGYGTYVFN
ncbi:MAG: AmmeMemoRadiSam system protein B [Halobacteria archaeon]|nr:AmmeMemoRadiSam system protein B [Halobacteria archaeon]